jgi:hypothetical protein
MPSKKKRRGFEKANLSNMEYVPPPVVTVGCRSNQKAISIVQEQPDKKEPVPDKKESVEQVVPVEQVERAAVLQRLNVLAELKEDQKIWLSSDGKFTPDTTGYGQWFVRTVYRQKRSYILDQIGQDVTFVINHKQDVELQGLCPAVIQGLEKTKKVYPKLSERIDNFISQLSISR